jgi:hypothetical protein
MLSNDFAEFFADIFKRLPNDVDDISSPEREKTLQKMLHLSKKSFS